MAAGPILDVPEATQRVLAAALLSAYRVGAEAGPDLAETARQAQAELELVPAAADWAERLTVPRRITLEIFADRCAPTMVRATADGTVDTPDRDAPLRGLLETAIAACPTPAQMHPARGRRGVVVTVAGQSPATTNILDALPQGDATG